MATSSVAEDVAMAAGVSTPELAQERVLLNRRLAVALGALVLAAALVLLAPRLLYAMSHVTTDDAYVDAYPAVVSARVPGAVVAIPVHEGERVRKGEVIAKLDDTDARSAVIAARQQLLSAQAALAQAEYDARSEGRRHEAEAMRANALASQAGDRTRSLVLNARSNQAAAKATEQSITEAAAAVDAANAQIPAAQTRLDNAKSTLARMQKLSDEGYVSTWQVESAQNDYSQARATLESAIAAAAQARANLTAMRARANADALQSDQAQASAQAEKWGTTLAQSDALANSTDALAAKQAAVDAQRAQVSVARQAFDLAQYKLGETVLRAPIDGYVASRPATVGQTLQSGDPAVVVMPSSGVYVTANYKETQFQNIRDGARADVHIDAFPNVKFYGHVDELGAASQAALSIAPDTRVTGNFVKITQRVPVRIVIDRWTASSPLPLRPGMSAEVSIAH